MHSFAQLSNPNFCQNVAPFFFASKFHQISIVGKFSLKKFANFGKILANLSKKCDFRAAQRSALCRSRQGLSNAYLLAKFGFDTAENEPFKVR